MLQKMHCFGPNFHWIINQRLPYYYYYYTQQTFPRSLITLSLTRANFYTNSCDTDEKNRQYIKYVTPPVNCVTSVCIKKLCKKISRPSIFRKLILQFKSSTNQMKRNAYNTLGGYCKWTQRFGSCNIRKHIVFCFVCKKS